jgi:hypothetical protein
MDYLMISHQSLSLNGLQVLVVDSNGDSRDLLAMLFQLYGVEIIPATSVGEALDILEGVQPDLLISEIGLPKEDGYSLMDRVKALEVAKQLQIPAIALTTYARKEDRARALAAGFRKHIAKPFDMDELIATVAHLTRKELLMPEICSG